MKRFLIFTCLLVWIGGQKLKSQCTSNAGPDILIQAGQTPTLNGSASGGTPPYTYLWSPSTGLSSTTAATVTASGLTSTIVYTLTITDNAACTATSQVWIYFANPVYSALSKSLDGGYQQIGTNNKLYFKYLGEYNSGSLKYNIYNDSHSTISTTGVSLTKQPGDNRFTVDLTTLSISASGYYILEVINEKNDKQFLKFKK